ncbi:DUF6630 family protein [Neisseria blantyrii]|uniref:DUF6630 family protein n=1 Tax=Neisseria blantyrii TaxID=2830647 RepID=UPI00265ACF0D|nr:hypothetical protein [Neisseria blantyrii]
MKPEKILQKIVAENEYPVLSPLASQNEILREALYQNRIFLFLDWKGESGQGELYQFINERLVAFGKEILKEKPDDLYKKFDKEFGQNWKNGDFLPFAFDYFDSKLKRKKMRLMLLESGSDDYTVFIVSSNACKSLEKIQSDFWAFQSLNKAANFILYTVDCPACGQLAAWDLAISEPPPYANHEAAYCDSCYQPLWDADGQMFAAVEETPHYVSERK